MNTQDSLSRRRFLRTGTTAAVGTGFAAWGMLGGGRLAQSQEKENDGGPRMPRVPGKFLVHTAPGRTGSSHRGGLMRACGYMYLFKNYTLKDWVVFNERFAMPMRIGRFGSGM